MAALAPAWACHASDSRLGHDLVRHDSHLRVDGVDLPFDRWVDARLDAGGLDTLAIDTAQGAIELSGEVSAECVLSVHVWSQHEGDGEVRIEAGRLRAVSGRGGLVVFDGVRGRVPEGLGLDLGTATGPISVDHAGKGGALVLDSASGRVTVRGSEPASIRAGTASGDVLVEDSAAGSLEARTASGDVSVHGGSWGTIRCKTASGDLRLRACTADAVRLESASGDLRISGGHCKRAQIDSATGEIDLADGATVDAVDEN